MVIAADAVKIVFSTFVAPWLPSFEVADTDVIQLYNAVIASHCFAMSYISIAGLYLVTLPPHLLTASSILSVRGRSACFVVVVAVDGCNVSSAIFTMSTSLHPTHV